MLRGCVPSLCKVGGDLPVGYILHCVTSSVDFRESFSLSHADIMHISEPTNMNIEGNTIPVASKLTGASTSSAAAAIP